MITSFIRGNLPSVHGTRSPVNGTGKSSQHKFTKSLKKRFFVGEVKIEI